MQRMEPHCSLITFYIAGESFTACYLLWALANWTPEQVRIAEASRTAYATKSSVTESCKIQVGRLTTATMVMVVSQSGLGRRDRSIIREEFVKPLASVDCNDLHTR